MSSSCSSRSQDGDRKHRQVRVAIVGAGISGLAVANGLLKDNAGRFNVQVYERDTIAFDSERGGYQLRICGNGLDALRTISDVDLWNSLRKVWAGDEARAPSLVDPNDFNVYLRLADLKLYPTSRPLPRHGLRRRALDLRRGAPGLPPAAQRARSDQRGDAYALRRDGRPRLRGGRLAAARLNAPATCPTRPRQRNPGLRCEIALVDVDFPAQPGVGSAQPRGRVSTTRGWVSGRTARRAPARADSPPAPARPRRALRDRGGRRARSRCGAGGGRRGPIPRG